MAIYNIGDRLAIKDAIVALSTGTRVVSVTHGGHTVTYNQASLDGLRRLAAEMDADLARSSTANSRRVYLRTGKGL
jgi:gpW